MKIETKFDIGDTPYYIGIFKNAYGEELKEVIMCEILQISIRQDGVCYITDDCNLYENELFATREEAEQKLAELLKKGEK